MLKIYIGDFYIMSSKRRRGKGPTSQSKRTESAGKSNKIETKTRDDSANTKWRSENCDQNDKTSSGPSSENTSSAGEVGQHATSFFRRRSLFLQRGENEDESFLELQPLTKYTWHLYHVSPLFGFEESEARLKQYSLHLRNYFSILKVEEDVEYMANFNVIRGCLKTDHDMALKVEVKCAREKVWKTIYAGIMLSWGLIEKTPDVLKHLPLLLCRGRVTVKQLVHDALQKFFDCIISPYFLSQVDLVWLNGLFMSVSPPVENAKVVKFLLHPPWKSNINVEYKLMFKDVRALWNSIHPEGSDVLEEQEVKAFYAQLINHASKEFKINVESFKIDKIYYPDVGIGANGLLKCKTVDILVELLGLFGSESPLIDISKMDVEESI